jgi:uncharacterized protein YecE (DUF72 family)
MWAHGSWPSAHGFDGRRALADYATWCTAVEGNTTFYAVPQRSTAASWAADTPASFRFVCKLPQSITHQRRLRGIDSELAGFLRALEPLGERAEMLTAQLPASCSAADLGALDAALAQMPADRRLSVEVRHREFFADGVARTQLLRVLERRNAELVTLDSRPLYAMPPTTDAERAAWGKKPRLPVRAVALTDRPIVRLIGRDDPMLTVSGWQPWLPVFASWLAEGRQPTMFIHTPDNIDSPSLARRFHSELCRLAPGLDALPAPREGVQQMGLFDG